MCQRIRSNRFWMAESKDGLELFHRKIRVCDDANRLVSDDTNANYFIYLLVKLNIFKSQNCMYLQLIKVF